MADPLRGWGCIEPLLLFLLLETLWGARAEQIRYSVQEELDKGSFVGNIAKDLGLEPRELAERRVRIVSRELPAQPQYAFLSGGEKWS
ncbi:protocadherin gamma-A5-like [Neovison vison]|uniref:protocadherin gamma-A5-like n=1 Tax=Neovison vison TaxID=452646 RepID=UPI001CF0165C|nr:protocadherin gamma-A5-like [Neogale vison]